MGLAMRTVTLPVDGIDVVVERAVMLWATGEALLVEKRVASLGL